MTGQRPVPLQEATRSRLPIRFSTSTPVSSYGAGAQNYHIQHLLSDIFVDTLPTRQCDFALLCFGGSAMTEGLLDRYFRLLAGQLPPAEYGVIAEPSDAHVDTATDPEPSVVCLC
jgi:hypothetical protein